jgi:hypothetical protein
MAKKILISIATLVVIIGGVIAISAFEAHVINVTAHIENALYVHPESQNFETVFPQEKLMRSFFITTSQSFSGTGQRRVLNIDYVVKQKPKPRIPADASWCHDNVPPDISGKPNFNYSAEYLQRCYPVLCYYLSKVPDNFPPPGNDGSLAAFHPLTAQISGKINKYIDPADQWLIDLDVPCFQGQCAQDWTHQGWELPAGLEGQTFGCDIWVEVTNIY